MTQKKQDSTTATVLWLARRCSGSVFQQQSLGLVAMHHNPRVLPSPFKGSVRLFQFLEPAKEHMVKSIKFIWMAISL